MTVTDKHVSAKKLAGTRSVVDAKLKQLREYVKARNFDAYPGPGHVPDFASWTDVELGLQEFSKSVLYTKNYRDKQLVELNELLDKLRAGRLRIARKAQVVQELEEKVKAAEGKAQSYIDQWSMKAAEAEDLRKRLRTVEEENADLRARIAKVQPLRRVSQDAVPN